MLAEAGSDSSGAGACSPTCGSGSTCVDGGCVSCGAKDEACCTTNSCNSGLACNAAHFCSCGQPGEMCCPSSVCTSGSTCDESNYCACGGPGEVCCPASSRLERVQHDVSLSCTGPATGAQGHCTCLTACNQVFALRSDSTLWQTSYGAPAEITSDGTNALLVKSFGVGYPPYNGPFTLCAVNLAGNVYCQGSNSVGQLGYGSSSTTTQSLPVEVQAGTAPLSGITKVWVDQVQGALACAINAAGDTWCWGYNNYGQLGNGTTGNALSATPVMATGSITTPGGTQFTGVARMAVTMDHVCAVKTDGTVWCWGHNDLGQVGNGSLAQGQYANPQQVTALGTTGVDVAARRWGSPVGGAQNFSCALTSDTGVWCWGDNSAGELTPWASDGNGHPTPVEVRSGPEAGGPITGVTSMAIVNSNGVQVCVVQNPVLSGYPNTLSCWGLGHHPSGITQFQETGADVSGVFVLCPQSNDVGFLSSGGQFFYGPSGQQNAPSCP